MLFTVLPPFWYALFKANSAFFKTSSTSVFWWAEATPIETVKVVCLETTDIGFLAILILNFSAQRNTSFVYELKK